jgi:hypothetical protein
VLLKVNSGFAGETALPGLGILRPFACVENASQLNVLLSESCGAY